MLDKIGEMPLWKVLLAAFILFIMTATLVEELIINKIFHLFNKTLTIFEKQKKEDIEEFEDMSRRNKEEMQYDRINTDLWQYEISLYDKQPAEKLCGLVDLNNKLNALFSLPYVKRDVFAVQSDIRNKINKNNKNITKLLESNPNINTSACYKGKK